MLNKCLLPFAILSTLLFPGHSFAQLWITEQYNFQVTRNIEYGTATNFSGQTERLTMDVFTPECEPGVLPLTRPLMILIHGGSFLAGSKEDPSIQALCVNFAKRGYVTASINYRKGFIADDSKWECNYPNYKCVFATDASEWQRAYYRAVQDAKGALRFLLNRKDDLRIDPNHVFVTGESAGAFISLGVGLMDVDAERPPFTNAQPALPSPHPFTYDCEYNVGKTFDGNPIARPDLGGIDGTIAPGNQMYTIKGIGNFYGGMLSDLLKLSKDPGKKPAIYSFHRPCDPVVPIDSAYVNWGLSWCFTNGYGCFGIKNNENMLYGSRTFSQWNTSRQYGYTIENHFTNVNFPFQFVFGEGSCTDQLSNPCHAYDNKSLREKELATFFSKQISLPGICNTTNAVYGIADAPATVYPNPGKESIAIEWATTTPATLRIFNSQGILVASHLLAGAMNQVPVGALPQGIYHLELRNAKQEYQIIRWIKL
jgi:hypothetical protein